MSRLARARLALGRMLGQGGGDARGKVVPFGGAEGGSGPARTP
jgi:hypothetical protein